MRGKAVTFVGLIFTQNCFYLLKKNWFLENTREKGREMTTFKFKNLYIKIE